MKLTAIVETQNRLISVNHLFYQLTQGASQPGSLLYESQDEQGAFTGFSIGIHQPSLCISGKGAAFQIRALDARGQHLLSQIILPDAATVQQTDTMLSGHLAPDLTQTYLEDRLHASNHMDLIRCLLCDVSIPSAYTQLPLGLFGGFAYDFIRQFESIPAAKQDVMQDDDYCFYLATRLFIVDHTTAETHFISLIPDAADPADAKADIQFMIDKANVTQQMTYDAFSMGSLVSDTKKADYLKTVDRLKSHILAGDAFQIQYGRMQSAPYQGDCYKVYAALKNLNPSPYMFYMRDHHGVLLGASPELNISVKQTKNDDKEVVLAPIAGTKPRGFRDNKICPELDQRYAIALQTDEKELAEHVMLIDLVRNDIAAIAKTGTTQVTDSFAIKKFSHVQHLVSRVKGVLKEDVDALTAYLATMNMGTLTGAPKVRAMALIAQSEENEHGYFGGGFGFITHSGEMETSIVIRSMRFKDQTVYIRAAAGIVADSVPESEYQETEAKMRACVRALEEASA